MPKYRIDFETAPGCLAERVYMRFPCSADAMAGAYAHMIAGAFTEYQILRVKEN